MSSQGGTKAVVAALAANLGIAATKFLAFALTRSSSMLAEGVHSLADSGNQVLLLWGGKRARRGPTAEHPFGYGRERYIYSFIVAIVLFSVGGLFALYEGWHKFADPHPFHSWQWVPVVVLVVAIIMEGLSLRTAVKETNKVRGQSSFWQFIHRAKSPELPVILLEDVAALAGLVFALIGVSLTLLTHDGRWDAVGSVAIGILLVVVAALLARETKSLLLGEGASAQDVAAIEAALVDGDDVQRVIHLRTLYLGPEELLVAAKLGVAADASAAEIATAINSAEARVRVAVPLAHLIYLEPDLWRADQVTGAPVTAQ